MTDARVTTRFSATTAARRSSTATRSRPIRSPAPWRSPASTSSSDQKLLARIARLEAQLRAGLTPLLRPPDRRRRACPRRRRAPSNCVRQARRRTPAGISIGSARACRRRSSTAACCSGRSATSLYFMPPYVITDDEVDWAIEPDRTGELEQDVRAGGWGSGLGARGFGWGYTPYRFLIRYQPRFTWRDLL